MLFQAVVIFLPILIFFKFHVKGERSIEMPKMLYMLTRLKDFFKLPRLLPGVLYGDFKMLRRLRSKENHSSKW